MLARIAGRRAYKGRTVEELEGGRAGARVRGAPAKVIVCRPVPSCPAVAVVGFAVEVLMRCAVLAVLLLGACVARDDGAQVEELKNRILSLERDHAGAARELGRIKDRLDDVEKRVGWLEP